MMFDHICLFLLFLLYYLVICLFSFVHLWCLQLRMWISAPPADGVWDAAAAPPAATGWEEGAAPVAAPTPNW
jgi:hypothetical protein